MTTQTPSSAPDLPVDMIIFGGAGDLSARKLLPALYMAHLHGNLPAQSRITVCIGAANRDPRQFADPDRLDVRRDDGAHVGFGYGRHQCVGQQLARMELQIALPTLFRRIPTLQLAVPVEELPFKHDTLAYGVYELPVTW